MQAGRSDPAVELGGIKVDILEIVWKRRYLDSTGHILLNAATSTFAGQYGIEYLYLGLPPWTPYPPVAELHV